MIRRSSSPRFLIALFAAALIAITAAACGSDDSDSASGGGGAKDVKAVEKAFLTGMFHHHESAIEMAEIAQEKGKDPFVKKLGGDIVVTQEGEIEDMKAIYTRLIDGELRPDPAAHDGLGLSAEEAGMTHSEDTNEMLRSADPFDRAFVDEMVPHHTGAVKMAEVVLESTKDAELRKLAEGIVSTQEREINEMNSFRTETFGGPVPEGAGHGGEKPASEEHGSGHSG